MSTEILTYSPQNKIRFVTAASLFDGHDASINIMRRILQQSGVEVIHLGHNRSVQEIVQCAIQEDVQGIAITSYQGGHVEYFQYMIDLLKKEGANHIRVFGGGGGTILPSEIQILHQYGVAHIYSPDEGRTLGLQGMINDVVKQSDFATPLSFNGDLASHIQKKNYLALGQAITQMEFSLLQEKTKYSINLEFPPAKKTIPVLGITGTGGAGKSSLTDELVRRYLDDFPNQTIAILSVDPSKRKTGGALLGDRIRMNSIFNDRVYMRSFATREANIAMNRSVKGAIQILKSAGYDLIIVETAGIGQSDSEITEVADVSLYVMTPEYGAATQLEKIDMIDYADVIAINKFDKRGALDALRDVKKQYQRSRNLFNDTVDSMPVFGTIASQFQDAGTDELYAHLMGVVIQKSNLDWKSKYQKNQVGREASVVLPPDRVRYLTEIKEEIDRNAEWIKKEADLARSAYQLKGAITLLSKKGKSVVDLESEYQTTWNSLSVDSRNTIETWSEKIESFRKEQYSYFVRGKEIKVDNYTVSLSHLKIPKIATPRFVDWGDILEWSYQENFPGFFPYTAGVYPYKRSGEDPTRMFAGEGGPERTNRRFHYLSSGMPAKRLSTAFDSVTLYGEDPDIRPDIYGKIGNSGVNVATLDDAKKLYSGFDLCDPSTSVSMTINGPAPMVLAFFLNAAIDQACEKYIRSEGKTEEVTSKIKSIFDSKGLPVPKFDGNLPETNNGLGLLLLGVTGDDVLPKDTYEKLKKDALSQVRGTVQADILKEDQAQNTCIFSTEFALKMMGDIQHHFIQNQVRNFYSVSISGYHIAEAGANPITQVAFTLANGFTYVEYYLSRGMDINDFAPNLSFFFSNGIDPEYSVIGRVARRIWAKAMKFKYRANERSQMLKYHIQTSGRSLHSQEIDFNDIRTTLQALYAIYDNCNSLHTNAYDEAITTPTEESVRRAVAIQLIINRELGLAKNENPLQGAFIIEELTNLVEEAILTEFNRLTERGGVLGAMERMYQRNKIQEESLHYETLKHTGEYPIIGVNTFLNRNGSPTVIPGEVIRSTDEEKQQQIGNLKAFQKANVGKTDSAITKLKQVARAKENIFQELLETVKVASLGQISHALYEVGGQYRRNM
ncbi:methylmalonyl-CoA mutase [Leptospira levettii]|uniref:methylmalonyl-CoA mutase family protein n=1 Tax=Leptospira levettii TaxID=2023178 RepID=UPI000C298672|nr:methylmalonyl-CoA mutase family protein [Leptospira levettii]MCW7474543.1 methylmalonyl-CoA mutase family protein [Leptospira levettii]PJZ38868.1 methylmalonyl-CoA mutase [Leptospira levettii]PJZ88687.1 methylmalonyl-CoA mutase [Leptospira levettii]PKA02171.1 methylmalonyl-CoA mutase [Leptospira levettii]